MISPALSPMRLDSDCCQASCRFDKNLFRDDTTTRLGLALPPALGGAVQKRKAEFIAGRYCARAALAQLGGDPEAMIGSGPGREPLWPEGFVGSITHTAGYASAIVARREKVRAVGMDSEMWIRPESVDHVCQQILTCGESHANFPHLFESPRHYLTLVFSAKESVFKCLYPLVNRFFDFHAAVIIPQPIGSATDGAFDFELLQDLNDEFGRGYRGRGSYAIDTDGAHTTVILKAETSPHS